MNIHSSINTGDNARAAERFVEIRDGLLLFDCCCGHADDLRSTMRQLRRYGIRRAVVTDCPASEAGGPDNGVYAAPTVNPLELAESADIRALVSALIAQNAAFIRLNPQKHGYDDGSAPLQRLLHGCEAGQLPVCLVHSDLPFESLDRLLSRYPDLPVILDGGEKKLLYHTRELLSIMERRGNLYLEIHNLTQYAFLPHLIRRFGTGRLLYGSHFPKNNPDAASGLLVFSELSMKDRQAVAHGNLERLINTRKEGSS